MLENDLLKDKPILLEVLEGSPGAGQTACD